MTTITTCTIWDIVAFRNHGFLLFFSYIYFGKGGEWYVVTTTHGPKRTVTTRHKNHNTNNSSNNDQPKIKHSLGDFYGNFPHFDFCLRSHSISYIEYMSFWLRCGWWMCFGLWSIYRVCGVSLFYWFSLRTTRTLPLFCFIFFYFCIVCFSTLK